MADEDVSRANIDRTLKRLAEAVKASQDEGVSGVEIGAAVGQLIATLVPNEADQAHIFEFARRHGKRDAKSLN